MRHTKRSHKNLPRGVHVVFSKGKMYVYAWRGGPRLYCTPGTPEFYEEYLRARASWKFSDPGKIAGLCGVWKASKSWADIGANTKKNWSRWLDEISDHFGPLQVKQFDRPEIKRDIKRWRDKWAETPRAADMAKQVLSALLSFAVEEGYLRSNPCFGIPNLYKADRSARIWTAEDISKIEKVASKEVTWALKLACLTGLRRADLLALSWSHIGQTEIEIATAKSGRKRSAVVPLHQDLKDLLSIIPKRATTVLTNSTGRPWGTGFSSSWNKATKRAGLEDLHFHDARGTFATLIYRAGFSEREIAESLGWSEQRVDRIIRRYVTRSAALSHRAKLIDANATGTGL